MTELDVLREMLQYRMIRSIFSDAVVRQGNIALKGGFAMRTIFNSYRSTKDIDLQQDGKSVPLRTLQRMMNAAIKTALTDTGLTNVSVTAPKQTDTVARWKINGYTEAGSLVHLTIEVSRRGLPREHIKRMPAPGGGTDVLVYSADAMAASKTVALVGSAERVALRDVWDLDILISMKAEPPADMIRAVATPARIQLLYDKLEMMTWEDFQNSVAPHLDAKRRLEMTEDKFEEMKIRVGTTVERWLNQAMPEAARQFEAEPVPA